MLGRAYKVLTAHLVRRGRDVPVFLAVFSSFLGL